MNGELRVGSSTVLLPRWLAVTLFVGAASAGVLLAESRMTLANHASRIESNKSQIEGNKTAVNTLSTGAPLVSHRLKEVDDRMRQILTGLASLQRNQLRLCIKQNVECD